MSLNAQPVCAGLWRWLQGAGLERFEFERSAQGWVLRGTILVQADSGAAEARYEISCDRSFRTRHAHVSLHDAAGDRELLISVENGLWRQNGRESPSVRGALDIDLGWSPSTNTLPIRRLELETGQSSGEIVAAWVRFPELALEPLPQEYLRVAERVYRYSSRGGAFTAELTVDDDGLVVDYEGLWQRVLKEH